MKNGATIKNAEVAVYVGEYFVNNGNGALLNNHGGGIIKINGAHFLNNQKDIVMQPYELWSTVTHKAILQRSYIQYTTFKNDANMLFDASINNRRKLGSIFAYGIKGLRIEGNAFENADKTLAVQERGTAITANNSSLDILPYYDPQITPPVLVAKNKFKNLYYGVNITNGINEGLVKINENVFSGTYHSIFASGSKNLEILQNSILVPDQTLTQAGQFVPPRLYGIYLNGGKGFRVEENTIYRPSSYGMPATNGARGIIVHNTGAEDDQIYKNTLNNLFLSEQAQGFNSGKGTMAEVGLKFFCNSSETEARSYDFYVFGSPYWHYWSFHRSGIATAPMALALLKRDNPDYVFNEIVNDVSQNSARKAKPNTNNTLVMQDGEFKLYPNPARDYTTLKV